MDLLLKVVFYSLWAIAGAFAGFFMRYAEAREVKVGGNSYWLLALRAIAFAIYIGLIGGAMEITALVEFNAGETLPAGILCAVVCVATYKVCGKVLKARSNPKSGGPSYKGDIR